MWNLLPRRTVRLRLTAMYGVLFVLSGAVLLAIASGVAVSRTSVAAVPAGRGGTSALARAHERIRQLQSDLANTSLIHAGLSHELLIGSAIALGIMTVVSLVVGWGLAGRMLRPLRAMTAATRRISADNLQERLALSGPRDELTELADTIDGLLERLEGAFAAQRRFVANASHELRTPLTTIRAALDVAVAKPEPVPAQTIALAGRLRAELDRVDGLLDGLLALARAQHGVLPGQADLSLADAVSGSISARAGAIAASNLTVLRENAGATLVTGSEPLLRRMVDNVIDNAVVHNSDGGWIRASAMADGGRARLVVETGGQLLDQQQVAQLGQPFRRLGADRTGSDGGAGLGLSIVAAIAAAHGGTLDLHARPEGGLRVAITLPLAGYPAADGGPPAPIARAGVPT
ncbi:MAG TPA: HAMP domain-containing sensor histidine kinase [Streptosporangiaceae bacterium]